MVKYINLFLFALVVAFVGPGEALAVDSFFDVFSELSVSSGPPYPATDSINMAIGHEEATDQPPVTDAVLRANLKNVVPVTTVVEVHAHATGGKVGLGTWNSNARFDDFSYSSESYPVDSFFDVFFDIDLPAGGSPILNAVPNTNFVVDSFFDITYRIDFADGGYHNLQLHGEVQPGVPGLRFTNVEVQNTFLVDSFFDVFFDITVTDPQAINFDEPIVQLTMSGSYVPEPATLGLLLLAGLAVLTRKR